MKKILLLLLISSNVALADLGEMNADYARYYAIQNQVQNQRMMAYRNQLRYKPNPMRNIKFPKGYYDKYPNISDRYPQTQQRHYNQNYYNRIHPSF